MDNIASLMSNLTDEQVSEYQLPKYPPSVRSLARQEAEARIVRRERDKLLLDAQVAEEVAKEARKATITKIAKGLEKVWTDDLTNVLITMEEVDDLEHGEEIEVVKVLGEAPVKETRYPKVKTLVVRTNVGLASDKPTTTTKLGKSEATKRAIKLSKRSTTNPNQLELVGIYRSANEACGHLGIEVGQDSATRVLQRDGYFTEPTNTTDYTIAK